MTDKEVTLTEVQIRMLTSGEFHLDGWNSRKGLEAAARLHKCGYVTCFESGSDDSQYTCYNYKITEQGKTALKDVTNGS